MEMEERMEGKVKSELSVSSFSLSTFFFIAVFVLSCVLLFLELLLFS